MDEGEKKRLRNMNDMFSFSFFVVDFIALFVFRLT